MPPPFVFLAGTGLPELPASTDSPLGIAALALLALILVLQLATRFAPPKEQGALAEALKEIKGELAQLRDLRSDHAVLASVVEQHGEEIHALREKTHEQGNKLQVVLLRTAPKGGGSDA